MFSGYQVLRLSGGNACESRAAFGVRRLAAAFSLANHLNVFLNASIVAAPLATVEAVALL
jgi:hypothetical protein